MTCLDPYPLDKQALKVTCPARKSTCPRPLVGTFFEPWQCTRYNEVLEKLSGFSSTHFTATGTKNIILYAWINYRGRHIKVGYIPSSETQGQSVGSGEKTGRKFSSTGEKAPGYRLLPNYFQKLTRMPAPDWAQKNALYYCAQSANSFSWVLFVSSYTTAYCLATLARFVHQAF